MVLLDLPVGYNTWPLLFLETLLPSTSAITHLALRIPLSLHFPISSPNHWPLRSTEFLGIFHYSHYSGVWDLTWLSVYLEKTQSIFFQCKESWKGWFESLSALQSIYSKNGISSTQSLIETINFQVRLPWIQVWLSSSYMNIVFFFFFGFSWSQSSFTWSESCLYKL